ncbi:MAG: hypothetical protein PHE72_14855, partial [candidate division Zixibacteria bacterium]|nr:hypothetical protein [candidate division Zixibacteria bacterium]
PRSRRMRFVVASVCTLVPLAFAFSLPFAAADEGGPGVGGCYSWVDSNPPAPIETYGWREIAGPAGGAGTEITRDLWSGDIDDGCYYIPALGFDFEFYGNSYSDLYVGTNGFVNFGACVTAYENEPIPTRSGELDDYIGAFWNDLDLNGFAGATVYYALRGSAPDREFVVEWYRVPHIDDAASRLTFQVVLFEGSNDVLCAYSAMTDSGSGWSTGTAATLGVEGPAGYQGLEYSYCRPDVADSLAVRYRLTPGPERILLLEETCGAWPEISPAYPPTALNNLGLSYTVALDPAGFLERLQNGGPYDLAIIDEYANCLDSSVVAEIGSHVSGGGRVIISWFGWDPVESCAAAAGFDAVFDASFASATTVPRPLYRWDAFHPIFTTPNSVTDFTAFSDFCNYDGAGFNSVTGGAAVAGFSAASQAGEQGIIIGNEGRTILNGEVFGVFTPDVVGLIENEILFIFPTPTPSPSPSPLTPTPTPEGYRTPTPAPSATVSPSPEGYRTPTPTPSPTPTNSPAPSPSPTPTCGPTVPAETAVIASGDYSGDGTAEPAVWRPVSGMWMVRELTRFFFGVSGDRVVSGDYDGDGLADPAVFRAASGYWGVRGLSAFNFGTAGDIPVPGDYDGDGLADPAVFRPAAGLWAIRGLTREYFGSSGDWPAPGDYDGDGWTDLAVFRPSAGIWFVRDVTTLWFGAEGDWPAPADYAGNGTDAAAIFRPCNALWAVAGLTRSYFGVCLDWPRPADYNGDGAAEPSIFRGPASLWAIFGFTRFYLGTQDDVPATR